MKRVKTPPAQGPARPAFKRRGHLVLALLAVLVLVGLVPLATMSWKMIRISRETLEDAEQEKQLMMAYMIAHELDLQVRGLRSRLVSVAQTLGAAVRRRGTVPTEEIRQVLGEVSDERMSYVRYTYFDSEDVKSVSAGEHPEYLEALFGASLGQAAELVATQRELNQTTDAILSDPILLRGEESGAALAIAAPVVSNGSFRGVLTALVDLDLIWQGLSLRKQAGHIVFALDERGKVFASNNRERIRLGQEMRDSPLVRRFLSPAGRANESMSFTLEREGEERQYLGAFEKTSQRWGIFVQAPDSVVYWSVRNMERSTRTWALALLLTAALAAMFFARSLSNPINRLAAASRRLAARDFSARVPVTSRNEIGELAHTFNTMAAEIEGYVQRLKIALEENNELFLGTIRALAEAIDAKDPYTRGHSGRVNRYSVLIAQQMGLSEEEIRDIYVSSLLHDVGKIGIQDGILNKAGALTDEEYEIIKTHAEKGAAIMTPIRQMKNMIPGIRHHHERCNGRGYPDGLSREQTPLMARIIAVADTFDAITTDRPYQQPMKFEVAKKRINELRGAALDEQVVDAFNEVCRVGRIRPEGGAVQDPAEPDIALDNAEADRPAVART